MEYNVPVDATIDKLIRKHEAGDFQTYNEFGKIIFRQLNGYVLLIIVKHVILELRHITELIKLT